MNKLLNHKIRKELPEHFCPLPFSDLTLGSDGQQFFCETTLLPLGSIYACDLNQLLSSSMHQDYRTEYIDAPPTQCVDCLNKSNCHISNDELIPLLENSLDSQISSLTIIVTQSQNTASELERLFKYLKHNRVLDRLIRVKIVSKELSNQLLEKCLNFIPENIILSVDIPFVFASELNNRATSENFIISSEELRVISLKQLEETATYTLYTSFQELASLADHLLSLKQHLRLFKIEISDILNTSTHDIRKFLIDIILQLQKNNLFIKEFPNVFSELIYHIQDNPKTNAIITSYVNESHDRHLSHYNSYCGIPFGQVVFTPKGDVVPCTYLDDYSLGNITENSISDILNSTKAITLRDEFINGTPKICSKNIEQFNCHKGKYHLKYFNEFKQTIDHVTKVDLLINGKCNLECIMCGISKFKIPMYNDDNFFNEFRTNVLPNLLQINLEGGEPFLQREIYQTIRDIHQINPHCIVGLLTNGHYKLNDYIIRHLDLLPHISSVTISLDSLKEDVFAKIRTNGKLKKTLACIDSYIRYRDQRPILQKFDIFCNFVIQSSNYMEVPAYIDYCHGRGIKPLLNLVVYNDHLSIQKFSKSDLYTIIVKYETENQRLNSKVLADMIIKLKRTIDPTFTENSSFKYNC